MEIIYKWLPVVDLVRCTGCGLCVAACGPACLKVADGKAVLTQPDICGSEEHCIPVCRDDAIRLRWVPMALDERVGQWRRKTLSPEEKGLTGEDAS